MRIPKAQKQKQQQLLDFEEQEPLVANLVTTSKALVARSDALVPSSFLLRVIPTMTFQSFVLMPGACCHGREYCSSRCCLWVLGLCVVVVVVCCVVVVVVFVIVCL